MQKIIEQAVRMVMKGGLRMSIWHRHTIMTGYLSIH